MENLLANAALLSPSLLITDEEQYDIDAHQVLQALKKLNLSDASKVLEVIQAIDPQTSTIPYVFLLSSIIDSQLSQKSAARAVPPVLLPEGKLWSEITQALLAFDPYQVRYVGTQFVKIVEVVFHGAQQTANYVPAVQLFKEVISRLDPSSSTMSITHWYFVNACVHARAYQDALAILDRPIYHVPTSDSVKVLEKRLAKRVCSPADSSLAYINPQTGLSGKITYRVLLEYYLLGALCYIGSRQWKKAQAFLEVVLAAPCQQAQNVTSVITIEAYKKWLLLSLIIDGNVKSLPKTFRGNQVRSTKTMAKPYECVVEAYKTRSLERLQAEVQEGLDIWTGDANIGLVNEVINSLIRFEVIRLGETFAALPVEELARALSRTVVLEPSAALKYVQQLIETGELKAEIIKSSAGSLGTVRFNQSQTVQKSEQQISQELTLKAQELKLLLKHITDYDHQLEVSRDYVDWLLKAKKSRDADKKAGQNGVQSKPIGFPPGPNDMDEDMMDDYA